MIQYLIAASIATLLCGCDVAPVQSVPPAVIAKDTKVNIDPELLKKCEPMAKLTLPTYTQGQAVEGPIQTWTNQYTDCATRDSKLVDLATKAFDINDIPANSK